MTLISASVDPATGRKAVSNADVAFTNVQIMTRAGAINANLNTKLNFEDTLGKIDL